MKMLAEREQAYTAGAHFIITTDGVYFPRIYQILYRKMKEERYGSGRKKNQGKTGKYVKRHNNGGYSRGYNK